MFILRLHLKLINKNVIFNIYLLLSCYYYITTRTVIIVNNYNAENCIVVTTVINCINGSNNKLCTLYGIHSVYRLMS